MLFRSDIKFLPSARSIAFRKSVWESVGGFSEKLDGAAEDTVFNFHTLKIGTRYARVKDAVVEWGVPQNLKDFFWKVFSYAKGDAKSKIWLFPGKGLASHNIKALFVILRYLTGVSLLFFGIKFHFLLAYLLIFFVFYLIWAYIKAGLNGVILQIVGDFAVMGGFLNGIFR